jgi:hypothetical protein
VRAMRRFLRLPTQDRRLLVAAVLLLGTIRLAVRLLPFQTLYHLLTRIARAPATAQRAYPPPPAASVTWAVTVASRFLPGSTTCLAQALATQLLLRRRGHSACLRLGVARSGTGMLQAHAWVESDGKVVIGRLTDLSRYVALPPLERDEP